MKNLELPNRSPVHTPRGIDKPPLIGVGLMTRVSGTGGL